MNLKQGRRGERNLNWRDQKDDRHADRRRDRQRERPSLIGGLRESLIGRGPDGKPQTIVGGARGKLKGGMKQVNYASDLATSEQFAKSQTPQDVLYLMIVNKPAE